MAKNSIVDIASAVARKNNIDKNEAVDIVSAFFRTISEGLQSDKVVKVRGLGTFKITAVKDRESINVNTGERVVIKGHDKVSFVPDSQMKELVNKPFSQFTTVVVNDGVNFDSIDMAFEAEQRNTALTEKEEEKVDDVDETSVEAKEESDKVEKETENSDVVIPDKGIDQSTEKVETPEVYETPEVDGTSEVVETPKDVETHDSVETPEEVKTADSVDNVITPEQKKVEEDKAESQIPTQKVVKHEVVENKIVKQEVVEQQIIRKTQDMDNSDDEYTSDNSSQGGTRNVILAAVAMLVVGLGIGFVLGHYVFAPYQQKSAPVPVAVQSSDSSLAEAKDTVAVQKPDSARIQKDSVAKSKQLAKVMKTETKKDSTGIDFKKLNADRRLRFGAYEIVGVDKTVKLKKGQTVTSYAKKTLGSEEMVVYFKVLNGTDNLKEGDVVKVPKIRLKSKFKR